MKKMKLLNNHTRKHKEIVSFFNEEYTAILEKAGRLDDLYWEIEKDDVNDMIISELDEILGLLHDELEYLYTLEDDYLYKEAESLMHDKSKVILIKNENENILLMCSAVKQLMKNKRTYLINRDVLQAGMITLADLIVRSIKKKEKNFFRELKVLLPEDKLKNIKQKIKGKLEYLTL